MTFRNFVKKAFRRNSERNHNKNEKPKIEYYRRGECPRSKYRGPVDPEHRQRLYDWSFATATADRRRSFDLDLSPCTSPPDCPEDECVAVPSDDAVLSEPEPEVARKQHIQIDPIAIARHEVALPGSFDTSSDQSTAAMSSWRSSSLTLKDSWDWPLSRHDVFGSLKEPLPLTAPLSRRISAPEKHLPFDLQDLSTALNAVGIMS